jgi:hypothetical protein
MANLPFRRNVILGEGENSFSITLYSIGWLSFLVRRHVQTVRIWERDGILPKPVFDKQVDDMYRWYCAAELMGYAQIYQSLKMPSTLKDSSQVAKSMVIFKRKAHSYYTALKNEINKTSKTLASLPKEEFLIKAVRNNRSVVDARMSRHFVRLKKSADRNGKINE